MSRSSAVRVLLGCVMGASIGCAWNASDAGGPISGYVLILLLAIAAYIVARPIGDDQ